MIIRIPLLVSILFFVTACTTYTVTTDYNPQFDVSQWKTYSWQLTPIHPEDPYDNDLNRQRVQRAINQALSEKGYTQKTDADFQINYFYVVESKVNFQRIHRRPCPWINCHYDDFDTYVNDYKYGSLIVDFVDTKQDELKWRGVVGSRVSEGDTPEEREANIQQAVIELMKQFPPNKLVASHP